MRKMITIFLAFLIPLLQVSQVLASTSDKNIILNPGHGYTDVPDDDLSQWGYQDNLNTNSWLLQRPTGQNFNSVDYTELASEWGTDPNDGIIEDFTNYQLILELQEKLEEVGLSHLFSTREMDRDRGNYPGTSYPWWQMSAAEYIADLNSPCVPNFQTDSDIPYSFTSEMTNIDDLKDLYIKNGSPYKFYDYDTAIRSEYGDCIGADLMVSIHTNGASSEIRGTEIIYSNINNPNGGQKSQILAKEIRDYLFSSIKSLPQYSDWVTDRRNDGLFNSDNYGEARRFDGPAVIVELGFHSNPLDNAALVDPIFREAAINGIAEGILSYIDYVPQPPPLSPLDNDYAIVNQSLEISWESVLNAVSYNLEINFDFPNGSNLADQNYQFNVGSEPSFSINSALLNLPGTVITWRPQAVSKNTVEVVPEEGGEAESIPVMSEPYANLWTFTVVNAFENTGGGSGSNPQCEGENAPEVCGVDFTEAVFAGITIDPQSNALQFILKVEEANPGDNVIDLNEKNNDLKQLFLQALAIPNQKQWISLDVLTNPDGTRFGSARTESPFENTDLADYFFDADVKMKFDLFTEPLWGNEIEPGTMSDWVSIVQSSPNWPELQAVGFNTYPNFQVRAAFIPGSLSANEEGGTIFVDEATIQMEREIMNLSLNLSDYSLSQELTNHVYTLLDQYEVALQNRLDDGADELETMINGDDPAYAGIREVYQVVTLAQWYKTQELENKPYEYLIDSENLTDLDIENSPFIGMDWDAEAWQSLDYQEDFTGLDATPWYSAAWGGVSFGEIDLDATNALTPEESVLINDVFENNYATDGDNYYLNAGQLTVSLPDPEITAVQVSELYPVQDESLIVTVNLLNAGLVETGDFNLQLYDSFEQNGITQNILVAEQTVSSLDMLEVGLPEFTWQPTVIGEHTLQVIIDPENIVNESNEANNGSSETFTVASKYPNTTIYNPINNSLISNGNIYFEGGVLDAKDRFVLEDESLIWTSDVDGLLGEGQSILLDALSIGTHTITFEATNSNGFSDSDSVQVQVEDTDYPSTSILIPVDFQNISTGSNTQLVAISQDFVDGNLCELFENSDSESITTPVWWSSSLDGELGYGCQFSTALSIGTHELTFSATNNAGNTSESTITVDVVQGEPSLLINTPSNLDTYYQDEVVILDAIASDLQEGNLAASIQWVSNLDGDLGSGPNLNPMLSPGDHVITAYVLGSQGLMDEQSVNISILYNPPSIDVLTQQN